ncbi:MAG: hypothetical protein ABI592_00425 [Acidobacteriota bacterium]
MSKKLALGVLTVIPILYVLSFLFFLDRPGARVAFLQSVHLGVIVLALALMLFYLVDVFRNQRVPSDKRALWAGLLVLGSVFVEPVYFWLYIWREEANS